MIDEIKYSGDRERVVEGSVPQQQTDQKSRAADEWIEKLTDSPEIPHQIQLVQSL